MLWSHKGPVCHLSGLKPGHSAFPLRDIRETLNNDSRIVFRPMESILMPLPWWWGHIVLIGDTAHATTPHLGADACIGIEDAIVLAQELERQDTLAAALKSFESRRERCRTVGRELAAPGRDRGYKRRPP